MIEFVQTNTRWFLSAGDIPGDVLSHHYDPALVLFSVLVAVLASFAAFQVTERIRKATSGSLRLIWLVMSSMCLGGGIWTMHFIGMSALILPIPVGYDPVLTILSIIPAVLASVVIVRPRENPAKSSMRFIQDSTLMGLGIGTMHYVGMAALQMGAVARYDPVIFTLSIVVAIAGSALSLQLKMWFDTAKDAAVGQTRSMLGAALVMGLAISATHYIAMQGAYFFQIGDAPLSGSEWHRTFLTNIVGIGSGIILLLLISAAHISRRMELLSMLEASETRQRAMFDSVAEGIVTINEQGLIRSFNHGAENIFQYSADEVMDKNVSVLVPEKMRSDHENYTRESKLNSPRIIDRVRDLEGRKKDGSRFPIELSVTPMMVQGKRYFIGVTRDISERKKYEENLLKAKEEAEQGNRAKTDFLASMSHELRTPLNAILGFAQFLKYDPKNSLNDEQTTRVDLIIKGGDYLLELIQQVLELNTIEAGRVSLTIDHISPRMVIDDCLALIRLRAADNDIEIIDETTLDDPPLLWTDETRLKQALLNILSNAVKYNIKGGTVTILCERRPDKMLRITVADTGPGIPKELQSHLFEPFERLGREAGPIEGTGIGLSITKNIVEVLGGRIDFTSEPGTGSTFWIDIPMIERRDTMTTNFQAVKKSIEADDRPPHTVNTGTVLYIEDNPEYIRSMEAIVGKLKAMKLVTAHNWEIGSGLARQHAPDLIILNVDLPGPSGLECLTECRNDPEIKNTPVLAVSAISSPMEIEDGIKAGFRGYLIKPFDVEKSIAIIDEILCPNL